MRRGMGDTWEYFVPGWGIYASARDTYNSISSAVSSGATEAVAATSGTQSASGTIAPMSKGSGSGSSTTPTTAGGATSTGGATGPGGANMTCRTQTARSGGSTYWRNVQQTLCNRGFDPGVIDGIVGTNTRNGIRAFQTASGIPQTGTVNAATASALGVSVESGQSSGGGGGGGGGSSSGGGSGGGTTPPPPPTQNAGIFSMETLRSPIFWSVAIGVLAIGGGVAYYLSTKSTPSRATMLGEMSDTGLQRAIYEQAIEKGVGSIPSTKPPLRPKAKR